MSRTNLNRKKKYKYLMHVTETVESQCVIESDRKLTFEQLRKRAEKRRTDGKLTCTGVSDVEIWCENAAKDGVSFDALSDRLIA